MAQLPRYNRKVAPQGLPDARMQQTATPESFGAAAFKGLSVLGAGMEERQSKQDTFDIMNAKNEMSSRVTDLLYNKDTGLMYKKSVNAKGIGDTFNTEFQKNVNDIRGKLNDRQRLIFDQNVTSLKNEYQTHITKHEVEQENVALSDAFKNATYNTAFLFSQPGVYKNENLVNDQMSKWEKDARAYYSYDKDKATADRLVAEGKTAILHATLNTLYNQNNVDGVKDFLDRYGNRMNPETISKYQGWVKQETDKVTIDSEGEQILKAAGGNLEKALALNNQPAKNQITSVDILKTIIGNESSGDYSAVNAFSGAKGAIQWMPGTWKQEAGKTLGNANAPMTKENQQKVEAAYVDRLYKELGSPELVAVAIYAGESNAQRVKEGNTTLIGDDGKEYSIDDPQAGGHPSVREYMNKFNERLKVDSPVADAERRMKREQVIRQAYAQQEYVKNAAEHDEQIRVKNSLSGITDFRERVNTINNSKLQPYQKDEMIKSLVDNRKSDKSTLYQLEVAAIDGTLSTGDIQRAASRLNDSDILRFSIKLAEMGAKRVDTDAKSARAKLKQDIEAAFPGSSNKDTRESLVNDVMSMLDKENVKGWQQYSRGTEFLKETGVVINNNVNSTAAKKIIHDSQTNAAQFGQLERDFGADVVRLAIRGFVMDGMKNPDAMEVNRFLSSIGTQISKGDSAAQASLDWLIRNEIPINARNYGRVYEGFANSK